ncbi:sensor histidine kinase [Permianibacter aggregans]|uniref:histidine kinase n=1 Tax=Permianibacter aggregans TaxID=1510150 RepID=A0A4R6UQ71_9GAMM|nr:ATP-binding protein [Permianibacter aggregans]QGX40103.1 hypothetical protein E2H98_10655 [Permianibacter aggregans]TDQ49082.1 phospho-acceptor domain-containing protein [Permianibacter aggregans]
MSVQLLTTITPPPPGFSPTDLARWQLLTGTVALYTDNMERVLQEIGDWSRMRGVVITENDTPSSQALHSHLQWLRLPAAWRNEVAILVRPMLDYLNTSAELEIQQRQRDHQLARLSYDFTGMHSDYQRVTSKLQRQLQQLRETETALTQLNDQLEQRVSLRTAELETALNDLESFSFSVSHDLRAPLRAIIGFTDDLRQRIDDRLSDDERGQVERVLQLAHRMNQLIDDLLRLAQTSQSPLQPSRIDLSQLVCEVWQDLDQHEPERRIAFVCEPTPPVLADPALIRVVLENLLGNARKFTQKVTAAQVSFAYDTDHSAYVVSDNGAGFDMAHADQLFAPFRRLHRQEQFEGTGIGLATVARIIHRHGCRIWPQASVNQGARFFFTLPPVT